MTTATRPVDQVNRFAKRSDIHAYAVSLAVENLHDRGIREPEDYHSAEADIYWREVLAEAEETVWEL